jgi:hypothetical protein
MRRTFLKYLRKILRLDIPEDTDNDDDPEKRIVADTVVEINNRLNKHKKGSDKKKKKNNEFVRKLRDTAFQALQRKCEARIWRKLIECATRCLNSREIERGRPPRDDWKQADIAAELCAFDASTISNAMAGKEASITLPRLIASLVHLKKHWPALEEFDSFEELHTELLIQAIGFAQACINTGFSLPQASADLPTRDELSLLKAGLPDESTAPEGRAAWKTWGMGWLVTKHKLGFKRGLTNEPKQSGSPVLPHGQRQPGGQAKMR